MSWRIEIINKPGVFDAAGHGIKKDIADLGIKGAKSVSVIQVYTIEKGLKEKEAFLIAERLLADTVTQDYKLNPKPGAGSAKDVTVVEVAHNPGVMDPVEESAVKAIKDLGIKTVDSIATSKKFLIKGNLTQNEIDTISQKLLYNKVIQHIIKPGSTETHPHASGYKFKLTEVDLLNADDQRLRDISSQGQLFLNLEEMKAIQKYFTDLKRNPTDCELETLAQTWSEHCNHKTFRGLIEYEGRTIDNLLKNTVMKATEELNKPWCVSVFKDNSGVITFNEDYNVCFKVETHNHPSALEPYGGASTGIGGVIRDIIGTGLAAKPIINTDIFCFGPPDYPRKKIPKGVLHPKRVMKGVVSGVRDYGNRMGIPTSNGGVLFDERYLGNPLVFCGNVGIMPKDKSLKAFDKVSKGDLIVVVGGKTGRDGIHGATFSSGELTVESEEVSGSAVQIGNPITEKKVTDTILEARDKNLFKAITDCGAGGLSSAVGEMGEETGAEVYLEKVPVKYKGLSYTEAWISEAQERMVLACDPKKAKELISVFVAENVEATIIGKFTDTKRIHLSYEGNAVCDLDMEFLHKGVPKLKRSAVWQKQQFKEPSFNSPKNLGAALKKILSSWNVCSKEWIIRQYDHEVQGGSVLKPLQGVLNDGPGDASITKPILDSKMGIIISCGINPRYGLIDPYWMAASAIDEALRQIIAVGGNLEKVALLDNFCWGNTNKPDRLGGLIRASLACYDTAKRYATPFISGKDSLNNEYAVDGDTISIPPTLLISAMAIMENVEKAVTMYFKTHKNLIYAVGLTKEEMGGSHYFHINGFLGNSVPALEPRLGKKVMERLSAATEKGIVRACHDCSEGGIGVALAEMAFSGGLGAQINLKEVPTEDLTRDDYILFSESNTRFIAEIPPDKAKTFEKIMKGVPIGCIGRVTKDTSLKIHGLNGKIIVDEDIAALKKAWQKPFEKY